MISISYLMALPGPQIKVGKLGNRYHVPYFMEQIGAGGCIRR